MSQESTPILFDWGFWSAFAALIAIVLSQIPPIHVLFKKAKIDFELYSKISLSQKVGNPNLQMHLLITNTGGRRIRIKKITASIQRNRQQIAILPAQNYLQKSNDATSTMLFTSFFLNPEEDWSNIINLLNFFVREDERRYREIEAAMQADVNLKRAEIQATGDEITALIEVEDGLTDQAQNFFDNHFIWLDGEYRLCVTIETDHPKANISKNFSFVIFETQSEELRKITEHFKYGGGFWWNPNNVPHEVILDVQEAA
jgi:hypothetical protein